MSKTKGLLERIENGEHIVVGEGYLFEFEKRGYLRAGPYTPEVVLDQPHLVKTMHEEFVHAGSDVVIAFTYYGHREKLRVIGWQDKVEEINRQALQIAREVADNTGTLMAGDLSNTMKFNPNDESTWDDARRCLEEQAAWAAESGADYLVGETFSCYAEAKMAVEAMTKEGKGLPIVITMAPRLQTFDKKNVVECCRLLEDSGASVVGLNCTRGPKTMLPVIKEVRRVCKGPIACLPVCYRTDEEHPLMQSLKGMETGTRAFPDDLDEWLIGRTTVKNFTEECMKIGVQYLGLCCGNSSHLLRTMAETLGRKPPGSKYSQRMDLHSYYGNSDKTSEYFRSLTKEATDGVADVKT